MLTRTYRIVSFGKQHYAILWQDHLDGAYQDTGYCTDHRGIIKQFDTIKEADDYLRDMQDAEDI